MNDTHNQSSKPSSLKKEVARAYSEWCIMSFYERIEQFAVLVLSAVIVVIVASAL